MYSPLFSIIVPCYNSAQLLPRCVESILNQSNSEWELILIDDGSEDETGIIADRYSQENQRIIVIHQPNLGVSEARNVGLKIASGSWVWFVDSDDYVLDGALATMKYYAGHYDCDTIFFGVQKEEQGKSIAYPIPMNVDKKKHLFLESIYSFNFQSILFSKSIISKYNLCFTKGIKMGEDLEFQYKYLLLCEKPISIAEMLYNYYFREGSATRNTLTHINTINDSFKILSNLLGFVKEYRIPEYSWFSKRINMIIKKTLFSALHVKDINRKQLIRSIKDIIREYEALDYKGIKDLSISVACFSLPLYLSLLRLFLKTKK